MGSYLMVYRLRSSRNLNPLENIVTSGLLLNLDAGNKNSYDGSSTSWRDISGNGNNFTLRNSPPFINEYGGVLSFNGSTQDATGSVSATNNFSFDIWFRPTTTHEIDAETTSGVQGVSGQRYLKGASQAGPDGGMGVSAGTNGISVYEHGSSYMPSLLVWQGTINFYVHAVVTYTNKLPRLYINGGLVRTGLTSPKTNVLFSFTQLANGSYGAFPGTIAIVKSYSRPLTSGEVSQNFNASRYRFGI